MNNNYHDYLKTRSLKAKVYRKYLLYPILSKQLEGKTLDIGCGIGDFLEFRNNTIGADINERLVGYNRERGRSVYLIEPDKKLPFKNESIDSIILDNVLEHITNPDFQIKEIYRILKKSGKLLVGVPGEKGFNSDEDHKIFYDKNKLVDLVESFSFFNNKIIYIPFQSKFLDKYLRIYCLYALFEKI